MPIFNALAFMKRLLVWHNGNGVTGGKNVKIDKQLYFEIYNKTFPHFIRGKGKWTHSASPIPIQKYKVFVRNIVNLEQLLQYLFSFLHQPFLAKFDNKNLDGWMKFDGRATLLHASHVFGPSVYPIIKFFLPSYQAIKFTNDVIVKVLEFSNKKSDILFKKSGVAISFAGNELTSCNFEIFLVKFQSNSNVCKVGKEGYFSYIIHVHSVIKTTKFK
jgi:hypothetical protein